MEGSFRRLLPLSFLSFLRVVLKALFEAIFGSVLVNFCSIKSWPVLAKKVVKKWSRDQKKWSKVKKLVREIFTYVRFLAFWPKKVVIWPVLKKKWPRDFWEYI